jgi:transcriptional regulator GlxA family with amidase domain
VRRRSSDAILQEDVLVAEALRFIMDHARQAIRVPDLVAEAGVSRRSLERRFSRATGNSILSEITRCRLERAQRLLRETNLPVYRVAAESGFGSVKASSRAFQLMEACSPAAFRLYSRKSPASDPLARGSGAVAGR